jgi:MtN3 and saliva related transmembrane protein
MKLPTNLIGLIAAFSTTTAYVPQLVRVWRRKSARDISLYTFLLLCFGLLMWLIYGLLIRSLPVIWANLVTLSIGLAILALKIRYD